jgi:hypothetical protein
MKEVIFQFAQKASIVFYFRILSNMKNSKIMMKTTYNLREKRYSNTTI